MRGRCICQSSDHLFLLQDWLKTAAALVPTPGRTTWVPTTAARSRASSSAFRTEEKTRRTFPARASFWWVASRRCCLLKTSVGENRLRLLRVWTLLILVFQLVWQTNICGLETRSFEEAYSRKQLFLKMQGTHVSSVYKEWQVVVRSGSNQF